MRPGLALLLVLGCCLVGCNLRPDSPELLQVSAVHPSAVEVGDRLEIVGSGFPEGRTGTATFAGRLARPGSPAASARGIVARAAAVSRQRLLVEIDPELVAAFSGRGAGARHTTFHGTVVVAFSPLLPGAPPVVGRLGDVEIDWLAPPPSDEVLLKQVEAGRTALDALGLSVAVEPPRGVTVSTLDPDGRAAQAGLLPGDQLLAFGGVRLVDEADFELAPGARQAVVRLKRGQLADPVERAVMLDGISPMPPGALGVAGLLVAVVVAAMLLLCILPGRLLTWVERRVAARLQTVIGGGRRADRPAVVFRRLVAALLQGLLPHGVPLALRVVSYLGLLVVMGFLSLIAFDGVFVAAEADLPLALLATITGLVCVGLVAGGRLGGPRWSLFAGMRTGLFLLGFQLPLFSTLTAAVLLSGSTRVRDLVLTQGAVPWTWHAFATPATALGLALTLLSLVPRSAVASRASDELDSSAGVATGPTTHAAGSLLAVADTGHLLVVAGLVALALLGGHALPGVAPTEQRASLPLQALGAALLAAKTWGVVAIIALLRWIMPGLRHSEVAGVCWRIAVPGSVAVVGLAVAWGHPALQRVAGAVSGSFGVAFSTLVAVLFALLAVRVLRALRRPALEASVNPWL